MGVFSNRWVQAGIAVALILGVVNGLKLARVEPTPEQLVARAAAKHCQHGSWDAERRASQAVRDQLVAPRSASVSADRVAHIGNCKMEVVGYVDAQNAFGAELRSFYIVTLQYNPEHDHWTTLEVVIQ